MASDGVPGCNKVDDEEENLCAVGDVEVGVEVVCEPRTGSSGGFV
jgi:hypothetical protein